MASSKPDCLLEPPQTQPKESRHSLEGGHTCSHTHTGGEAPKIRVHPKPLPKLFPKFPAQFIPQRILTWR